MFIKRLVLCKYKRLLLRSIDFLELNFTQIHQLIIGTNGSGKSSVLAQLTPLPPVTSDFDKGGYKIIELVDRNSVYVLTSDFTTGSRHTFEKDGVKLNDAGTALVQKELIRKHLRCDQELMDVLLGKTRFTAMAPLKRRDWILRLSGNDMSFAMSVFAKLKSSHRDSQGVVKHLTKRLSEEMKNLPGEDEVSRLTDECSRLRDELTTLMEAREPNLPTDVKQRLSQRMADITKVSTCILKQQLIRPAGKFQSDEHIEKAIRETRSTIAGANSRLDHFSKDYAEIADIIDALEKNNAKGIEDIEDKLQQLRVARQLKIGEVSQFKDYFDETGMDAQELLVTTRALASNINTILASMPENTDRRFSTENIDKKLAERDEIAKQIDSNNRKLTRVVHRLEHIVTATNTRCPKCSFEFIPGVGEDEETYLRNMQVQLQDRQDELRDQQQNVENFHEIAQSYLGYIRQLNLLASANESLRPLWNTIATEWKCGEQPRSAIPVLVRWEQELSVYADIQKMDAEIAKLESAIWHATEISLHDSHFGQKLIALQDGIESATMTLEETTKYLKECETFRQQVLSMYRQRDELVKHLRSLAEDMDILVRTMRNDELGKLVGGRQSLLARGENALLTAKTAESLIADLKRSRDEAIADQEAYDVLVKELSPVDGLIADQVKGFLTCFTDQINAVTDQVFTYSLKMLPCGMESEELDYKFPMSINYNEQIVPDVADGSSAQVDMINFAFVLVIMLYQHLEDFPLYIDELAPTMDEQHRSNMLIFVKQLLETRRAEQLFMISHYAVSFGSFPGAEVAVLDNANIITLPTVYNTHLTMR